MRLRVDLDFHFSGNCPKPHMTDPAISWREIAITLKTPVTGSMRVNAWFRQLPVLTAVVDNYLKLGGCGNRHNHLRPPGMARNKPADSTPKLLIGFGVSNRIRFGVQAREEARPLSRNKSAEHNISITLRTPR